MRGIVPLLTALLSALRIVMEIITARRDDRDREATVEADEKHQEELADLERDPAGWFVDHFDGDRARVSVRVSPDAGKTGSDPDPTEAVPHDPAVGRRGNVP